MTHPDFNSPGYKAAVALQAKLKRLGDEIMETFGNLPTQSDPINDAKAYSPQTLAKKWECSSQTIRRMIEAGEIKGFLLGPKLIRIPYAEVERFELEGIDPDSVEGTIPSTAIKRDNDNRFQARLERMSK